MSEFTAEDFDHFFAELWGKPPFAWQHDLAARVLGAVTLPDDGQVVRSWPEAIALPTAAGKTACIDIALFALASQSGRLGAGASITAPRRVFFVVDRRIIVDEAYRRAAQIARRLAEASSGLLREIADRLRHIAWGTREDLDPGQVVPLTVHRLRGGLYRSESWARDPLQPCVIASTVDQLGSRLLFRAYGSSGPGMLPVYAGLAANDSLVFLDEAHCARPFLQTLQAITRLRGHARQPLGRPFQPVILSATPPGEVIDRFEDRSGQGKDPQHPLGRRQLAAKPANLRPVEGAKGAKYSVALAEAMVDAIRELVADNPLAAVAFVNRVATARETYKRLHKLYGENVVLLTGRMRPIDRDDIVSRRLGVLASEQSAARQLDGPLIVVATQTLEVGADLDFDVLVSECASLDALRQRFGRLNRMGRDIESRAVLLASAEQAEGKEPDPVYGTALSATWAWLMEQQAEYGQVDFGIARMAERLPNEERLLALAAPAVDAAVLLPAHMDALCQTWPMPAPSPDVAPFLRGPQNGAADVQVCWRADLDLDLPDPDAALESLFLCPPSSGETLAVPFGLFRRWMEWGTLEDRSSDVESADSELMPTKGKKEPASDAAPKPVIRWRGRETSRNEFVTEASRVYPGDIIVIPAAREQSWGLGDLPQPVTPGTLDIGDRGHRLARGKAILRLHPALVREWPEMAAKHEARRLLEILAAEAETQVEDLANEFSELLGELKAQMLPAPWDWLPAMAKELSAEFSPAKLRHSLRHIGGTQLVLAGKRALAPADPYAPPDRFSDEDDANASGLSTRKGTPILLAEHLPGVQGYARRYARGCGLSPELVEAIAGSALLHDLGKADPRFQALLRGGIPAIAGEPLAKSGAMPSTRTAYRKALAASGYPEGGRHELLSVRMAESVTELLPPGAPFRELALHLIASHHGRCRPFAPMVQDQRPPDVHFKLRDVIATWQGATGLERLDAGIADRFWALIRTYGWWGLAWLETLLRLADHRRSEWEGNIGGN